MSYYGDNILLNPGAEEGQSHWSGSPTVVAGGTDGDYCFEIPESGDIYQSAVPAEGNFTGSIQIEATYLPEYLPARETGRESYRQIQVMMTNEDGTYTFNTCPCEIGEEITE
jgi:hypothetical protein